MGWDRAGFLDATGRALTGRPGRRRQFRLQEAEVFRQIPFVAEMDYIMLSALSCSPNQLYYLPTKTGIHDPDKALRGLDQAIFNGHAIDGRRGVVVQFAAADQLFP
jgi:hypothetical protein